MSIPTDVLASLITAVVGGLVVAIVNQLFGIRRTKAESEKLTAEAEKLRAEAAKIRGEIEKLNASVILGDRRVIDIIKADKSDVSFNEIHYIIQHKDREGK